jgi:Tol biopolymer transport system component
MLAPGTRLGVYEVVAALGAGGMGEVYKARDTRLDRTVAIKVLSPQLANNPEFRDRFEHEARTVSQLDHPHICALYDVGDERGTAFLVMQHLEGETLSHRLERGSLPLEEALRYAQQIADALEKAHRAGVVHRDVKPGNIMLTAAGAKLLDFGLARSAAPALATSGMSMLPTTPAANLTQQGTILGTFQYMAPEQLEGHEADARTDIFAFGAVLYEMVTGRKAFAAKSQATLIASIVGSEPPPVSALQPVSSPMLDDVVRTCLAKNPDDRWQSAGDLGLALALALKHRQTGAQRQVRRTRSATLARTFAGAALVAAAAVAAWFLFLRKPPEPARVAFDINPEPSQSPLQIALSPDGTRLVNNVVVPGGSYQLAIRRLDEVVPQNLAGTTGAQFPFWSADGRFIGFFASAKLNKIDLFGGPPQPLCDAPQGFGGTWNRDGVIVFAPNPNGPLLKVSASGGIAVTVTKLDQSRRELAHRHPKFLPDGNHFVYYVVSEKPENSGLYLGSVDSADTKRLVASDAMGGFVPPDRLVFMRGSTLMMQKFNVRRLALEGEPTPVSADVAINQNNSLAGFSFSNTGVLAYRVGGDAALDRALRVVDRTGKTLTDITSLGPYDNAALAPDATKLAETRLDGSSSDIWIRDLIRGAATRFTFDAAPDNNAVWSPDGSRIVFNSSRDGAVRNLFVKNANGSGQEEVLLKSDASKYPTDWTRDGRFIIYTEVKTSPDVWALPLFGDRKPIPLLTTRFAETRTRISPDGRWMAYVSDESGMPQTYVQTFPPSGGKWQVSTNGGVEPHWRADSRELFYAFGMAIWGVDVDGRGATFNTGTPRKLFDAPGVNTGNLVSRFDVSADAKRFLLNFAPAGTVTATNPIRVILNWSARVR